MDKGKGYSGIVTFNQTSGPLLSAATSIPLQQVPTLWGNVLNNIMDY